MAVRRTFGVSLDAALGFALAWEVVLQARGGEAGGLPTALAIVAAASALAGAGVARQLPRVWRDDGLTRVLAAALAGLLLGAVLAETADAEPAVAGMVWVQGAAGGMLGGARMGRSGR